MLVKVETRCPPDQAQAAMGLVHKMGQRPVFIERAFDPVMYRNHGHGICQILIYDIPDDQLAEGLRVLARRYGVFDEVPGYSWDLQIVFTQAEAIAMRA